MDMKITSEQIFKITKRASLEFDDSNPGFVSFRNMNWQSAKISAMRLVQAGFNAKVNSAQKEMIIVNI